MDERDRVWVEVRNERGGRRRLDVFDVERVPLGSISALEMLVAFLGDGFVAYRRRDPVRRTERAVVARIIGN